MVSSIHHLFFVLRQRSVSSRCLSLFQSWRSESCFDFSVYQFLNLLLWQIWLFCLAGWRLPHPHQRLPRSCHPGESKDEFTQDRSRKQFFSVKPLKLLTFQGCCRCGCYCRCNGVDFDEFILYNVQKATVTFLPTIEGNRTFELELALKTQLQEVTSLV